MEAAALRETFWLVVRSSSPANAQPASSRLEKPTGNQDTQLSRIASHRIAFNQPDCNDIGLAVLTIKKKPLRRGALLFDGVGGGI